MRHHPVRVRRTARVGFAAVAVAAVFVLTSCVSGPFGKVQSSAGPGPNENSPTYCGDGVSRARVQAPDAVAGFSVISYAYVWWHTDSGVVAGPSGIVSSADGSKAASILYVPADVRCFHLQWAYPSTYTVYFPG